MRNSLIAAALLTAVLAAPCRAAPEPGPDRLLLKFEAGDIVLDLYPGLAPRHVRQLIKLARLGAFDGVPVARIQPGFALHFGQVSDRASIGRRAQLQALTPLAAELSPEPHVRGTVSMIHGADPDDAVSAFMIMLDTAPQLDGKYTVFGRVALGWETLEKLEAEPVDEQFRPAKRLELVKAQVQAGPGRRPRTAGYMTALLKLDGRRDADDGPSFSQPMTMPQPEGKPELYWITGLRAEVLDPDGLTQQRRDLFGGLELEVDPAAHAKRLGSARLPRPRLAALSEGDAALDLPPGYGIPLWSDEAPKLTVRAVNHDQDAVFEIKIRVDVDYYRDRELDRPLRPVAAAEAPVLAALGEAPSVFGIEEPGEELKEAACVPGRAPEGEAGLQDVQGRSYAKRWTLKPGPAERRTLATRLLNLPYDAPLIHASARLRPFARSLELRDLSAKKSVLTVRAGALQGASALWKVGRLAFAGSETLYRDHDYELVSLYDEKGPPAAVASAELRLYFEDLEFKRPEGAGPGPAEPPAASSASAPAPQADPAPARAAQASAPAARAQAPAAAPKPAPPALPAASPGPGRFARPSEPPEVQAMAAAAETCDKVAPKYQRDCIANQATALLYGFKMDLGKASAACLKMPSDWVGNCLQGLGVLAGDPKWQAKMLKDGVSRTTAESAWELCRRFPNGREVDCVAGAADKLAAAPDPAQGRAFCQAVEGPSKAECLKRFPR